MIEKTTNYNMFKNYKCNRDGGVDERHVTTIMKSIQESNLLEFRPILVDKNFGVIDGQHRLEAAKRLGVPIYYQVDKNAKKEDIMILNATSKTWTTSDFLNFWVEQGNEEYIKLKKFMEKQGLSVSVALAVTGGSKITRKTHQFRKGEYVFSQKDVVGDMLLVQHTIADIKRLVPMRTSTWMNSSKFWLALLNLIRHPDFNEEIWFKNIEKQALRITPKVSQGDYEELFVFIHNHNNRKKIQLRNKIEDNE